MAENKVANSTTDVPTTGGNRSAGTTVKDMFASAPWESHHDKTLEALTHAKAAHVKALQAQAALKAAAESKHKAELAQRHLDGVCPPLHVTATPRLHCDASRNEEQKAS